MNLEKRALDTVVNRAEVASLKFDGGTMQSLFGSADLWPSWVADMDFKAAPDIISALFQRLEHGVFGYEVTTPDLHQAVANWYGRRYNWQFNPDYIISTPRTLNSLAAMITLFSSEGEGVIVQPPVFYDFKLILRANNRRLVKNPLQLEEERYQMDFEHLESVAAEPDNSLLILCNPHNPMGRAWSKPDLIRLAEICIRHKVFVIADEIHGDIAFENSYTPAASVSVAASLNTASCISPVKSFNLSGVANSMIVIENEEMRTRCRDWYRRMEISKNNVFTNAAMLAAYTRGEPWLEQLTAYLADNISVLEDFLREQTPLIKIVKPDAGFLLWIDLRKLELDAKQLEAFLVNDAKMATNPGHWFGREGLGFARINVACPQSVLEVALKHLKLGYDLHIKQGSKNAG